MYVLQRVFEKQLQICRAVYTEKRKTMKIFIVSVLMITCLIFCNAQDNSDPGPTCLGAGWYFQNNECQKCSAGYYCPGDDDKALQYACKEGTYQTIYQKEGKPQCSSYGDVLLKLVETIRHLIYF